jgi:hypothetical protein
MKVTVLKASKKLADQISSDLLSKISSKGNPIFRRTEIEKGFEIVGRKKNATGEIVNDTVFRYTNNPAPKFEYNEQLINL